MDRNLEAEITLENLLNRNKYIKSDECKSVFHITMQLLQKSNKVNKVNKMKTLVRTTLNNQNIQSNRQ